MTESEPPPTLADIEAAAAQRADDDERLRKSSEALKDLVLTALRSGTHRPTDITKASGWTAAYVRKLAREAGIEPNERYRERAAALRKTAPAPPAAEES
jgi:hypothetical protein